MENATTQAIVYYNGSCPICRAEIHHYRALIGGDRPLIKFCDLSDDPGALADYGVTAQSATRRLYTLIDQETLVSGIDAFIAIWLRIPRYRLAGRLASLPLFYQLGGLIYDHIAVPILAAINRKRIAKEQN